MESDAAQTTWSSLFSIGPKRITLTGAYGWTEEESKETGDFSVIRIYRDKVVDRLRTLAKFSKSVANSKDEQFFTISVFDVSLIYEN